MCYYYVGGSMIKKLIKFLTHRIFIVGVLLLIQLLILVLIVSKFEEYGWYFYIFFYIIGILAFLKIINGNANPSYKIAWIVPVLTIPIFGTLIYVIFGNKINKKEKLLENKTKLKQTLVQNDDVLKQITDVNFYNQSNYIYNNSGYPIYNNTYTEYLEIGEVYYKRLIEELKKAKKFIFMQYFIIDNGKFWGDILDVLKQKASEGLDVRVIYDDMGCIVTLPNRYYEELKKYGIKACSFNKFVPILTAKLNNRDHRKITIIDGDVGITGGINLADEYINEKLRFGHWKDNGILLKGDAVYSLTNIFLNLWDYINKIEEDFNKFKPNIKIKSSGYVQPYDDSPFDSELVSENICLNMINKAKKYVYITTPYLIIDNELETSLCLATKSGVDVRIITPGIPDKKFVNEVTKAYYNNLINSGVKIYEYTKGFIHAKTFLVDDEISTVGTVNLDYRSLHLHFECGVLLYKTESIKEIKKDISKILEISKQITIDDTKVSLFRSLKRAVLKLFAPLM